MNKLSVSLGISIVAAIALALLAGFFMNDSVAQVTKGKSRLLKTSQLMAGVVKPQCSALKKELEAGPADDEAWETAAMRAALLNEASYTLMDDGRCPDGVWAEAASKTLRDCSAAVVKAIDAKDVEAARTAFKAMTKSCAACHDKHKED